MTLFTKIYFMDSRAGQQRSFPAVTIVVVLFLLCIFPGQSLVAHLVPGISPLVQINPSLILMDIPVHFPVAIDMILVPGLFFLIYPVVILLYPSRPLMPFGRQVMRRAGAVFAGLLIVLFCMLSGGLIYYLVQDHLPVNIRKGIDAFGIIADIHLPYPGYETIHLRGSTVLLICFIIGVSIGIRKIRKEPGIVKAGQLTPEQRMTPYERMMQEKRMKAKQANGPSRQPAVTTPATNQKLPGIEQGITRPERNGFPRLCYSQPVMTFKPEAVGYMPMS